MRHFMAQFIPKPDIRANILPGLLVALALLAFYTLSVNVAPGWLTYAASSVALTVVGLTALARVNDISPAQNTSRWHIRRLGLILVGGACLWIILAPLAGRADFPQWRDVMIRVGIALTWITTPYMPPWWRYITGEHRTDPGFIERRRAPDRRERGDEGP